MSGSTSAVARVQVAMLPTTLTPATSYTRPPRPVTLRSAAVGATAELNLMLMLEMFAQGRLVLPETTWVREPHPTEVSDGITEVTLFKRKATVAASPLACAVAWYEPTT